MRVFAWLGEEKVVVNLVYNNIKDATLYIGILEQKPIFPAYKNFKVGDYVVVKNNHRQYIILRKVDKPIEQISNEWIMIG